MVFCSDDNIEICPIQALCEFVVARKNDLDQSSYQDDISDSICQGCSPMLGYLCEMQNNYFRI